MRWGEVETLKFVKLYLGNENLWNPCDADYKMKSKRQKAYNDIIKEFHHSTGIMLSEAELKIKVKNLRSTYTQEVTKIRQRSSSEFIYTPTIKWFAEWHSCFSSIKKADTWDDEAHNDKRTTSITDEPNSDPLPSQSDDYLILFKAEPQDTSVQDVSIKKKRKSELFVCPDSSEKSQMNLCSNSVEDEFDIYGKYLAAQLRSMDLSRALRVQLEIQSIVSEARISALSDT